MNIKIDAMTIDDLSFILENLYSDFDDFWSYDILKHEFDNPNSSYLVAKLNNEVVGFGGIWRAVDDVHITNIVTSKNFRHLGIASKILEKLMEMGKNENFDSITLEVAQSNEPAIHLYTKYQFSPVGNRKRYYDNGEDAILMTYYYHSSKENT